MTRTGLSPRLASHRREPMVEIHPADASADGLMEGDLATVTTEQGESVFRVSLSIGQRRGEMFTPTQWTDRQLTDVREDRKNAEQGKHREERLELVGRRKMTKTKSISLLILIPPNIK